MFFKKTMQLSLFDNYTDNCTDNYADNYTDGHILLKDLFGAYFEARSNKRNTINALAFEKKFETNIFKLYEEIISDTYNPEPSICFVVNKPVKREIFAADFRDRVIHHFIIGKLNPLFEKEFIYDSYACRKDKGTHFGIKRINSFIRKCSVNYKKNCCIMKLDIKGFFMHINKDILYQKLHTFISEKYTAPDKELISKLCHTVIFNNPITNCIIKGNRSNWDDLPPDKSLFHSQFNCGLPIGNLTSQVFANFYLNTFDHYVKQNLGIKFYGRYVDDFILVHQDKDYLKSLIPLIKEYLNKELRLTLHPKKIYIQHVSKGVKFLGTIIKPYRVYIANRTKGNFSDKIEKWNTIIRESKKLTAEQQNDFLSSVNSYLGIMRHYKTYILRKRMLKINLSAYFWNIFTISKDYLKLEKRNKRIKKTGKNLIQERQKKENISNQI